MTDEPISESTLQRVVALTELQRNTLQEIADLQDKLKEKNKALQTIRGGFGVEGALVSLMDEVGVESLTLSSGHKVTVAEILAIPSMAKDAPDREKVLAWAERSGNEAVIKDDIHIPFKKGDSNVGAVLQLLESLKLEYERYRTINAQTLGKLFREIRESGDPLPFDEIPSLQRYRVANVDAPSSKG